MHHGGVVPAVAGGGMVMSPVYKAQEYRYVMTDNEVNEAVARKLGVDFRPHETWLVRDYCNSIEAAFEILNSQKVPWVLSQQEVKLCAKEYEFKDGMCAPFKCSLLKGPYEWVHGDADTAPMAICQAFLKLP